MDLIKIALCDDEKIVLAKIADVVKSIFQSYGGVQPKLKLFDNPFELLKSCETEYYHLVLLDIDMPNLDGIELAKRLRQKEKTTEIIFITNREDRVFETFVIKPFGFVRKSRLINDITKAVQLFMSLHFDIILNESVFLKGRESKISFKIREIVYIEGNKNYQNFHIKDFSKPIEVRITMEKLESGLSDKGFYRTHKGFIINFLYLKRINDNSIELVDGTELPISPKKFSAIMSEYIDYARKRGTVFP